MISILSQADLTLLENMRTLARNNVIGYWQIYQTLADKLENDYGYPTTHSTVLWLRGATQANHGVGAFSALIRAYTNTQYQLRYNQELSDDSMQQASDQVAENLIRDLLGEKLLATRGIIPLIAEIATSDATGVGLVLFNGDLNDSAAAEKANSAWSGALLFEDLTSDQTWRLMSTGNPDTIDTLSDIRDILFAFQAYGEGIKSAVTQGVAGAALGVAAYALLKNTGLGALTALGINHQTFTDILISGQTIWNYSHGQQTNKNLWNVITDGTNNPSIHPVFEFARC